MSLGQWSICAYLVVVLLLLLHYSIAQEQQSSTTTDVPLTSTLLPKLPVVGSSARSSAARAGGGSLVAHSDVYIARNQRECFETRNLVSCIKYKASKLVWKLATNGMGFFPNEYERELDKPRWLRLVQLGEPADDIIVFNDAKSLEGTSRRDTVSGRVGSLGECVWLVKWESGRSRQLAGAAAAAYASGSKMAAGGFRDLLIAPTGQTTDFTFTARVPPALAMLQHHNLRVLFSF